MECWAPRNTEGEGALREKVPARLSERGLEGLGFRLRPVVPFLGRGDAGAGVTCFCLRPNRLNRTPLRQVPPYVGFSKEGRLDGSLELPGHLA